jgi:hypothetical protein
MVSEPKHLLSALLLMLPLLAASPGCSSSASAKIEREPLTVLRNPQRPERERAAAIDAAWTQAQRSPEDKATVRASFKDLVWSNSVPFEMRQKMYRYLANDPDPKGVADTEKLTRLMLPREPSRAMVAVLSDTAAAKGWKDCIPALIRSYSRPVPLVKDDERSEKIALVKLSSNQPLVQTVFEIFLNPPEEDPNSPADFRERTRADAFDVLGKLDVSGEYRKRLLEDPALAGSGDSVVALMRRCLADLKVVPITGEELRWLVRLADKKNAANDAWWSECTRVVAQLPPEKLEGLHLRHIEVLRFAATYETALFNEGKAELLSDLRRLVAARKTVQRSNEAQGTVKAAREQIEVWEGRLAWADLLTMHVLDRAIRKPAFLERLFVYVAMDRDDRTTEYGGVITTIGNVGDGKSAGREAGQIVAWLFPPRPGQRQSDREFVASEEMILSSDRSLAHFHFHVDRPRNADVAGPSGADLEYAARSGRTCVVFTSISTDELDVDYFQPDGVVIDLGTVAKN